MGAPVMKIETKDFNNLLIDAASTEMKIVGRSYSWTNGHVHSRIDRAIVNAKWIQEFPHVEVVALGPGYSDYCPLVVHLEATSITKRRPFKFFNVLAEHEQFQYVVLTAWNQPMKIIWYKIKADKQGLKHLNKQEFSSVECRARDAREKLSNIQAQMRSSSHLPRLFDEEKTAKLNLKKLILIEERIMRQKSRMN
ncbi:hypothetical protein RND71_018550 [Anisodus tanguticus]|uniref:Uncharacterized protein n=1 Tax=Anisodus tanguticus TaxID=243964 RepID=A0AAE1VJG3_9SOLA|nr:hypothetical protein RND71_018550 [Anisodus tanguticus]